MGREFTYHHARVVTKKRLSPHVVRLVIAGAGASGWAGAGVPDEAMLMVVPEGGVLTMPDEIEEGDPYERSRWYTVRRLDEARDEITVDVIVHETGLATTWAVDAAPGDVVGVSSTHHWYALPAGARWQVLIGDIAALPALARIIEGTTVPTTAQIEIPDPRDAQTDLDGVGWVHNDALATSGSRLEQIVREMTLPEGPGYLYVAGEASATRAVRKYLRHELGLGKESYGVVGYWRVRSQEWMRRYDAAKIDLERLYAEGEQAGLDEEELSDAVDRELDAAGL